MRKLRMGFAALVALAGAAALAAPNLLINLDATDFDPVGIAWVNNGSLGGTFVPVGNGSGTIAETVAGVPAVTFTMRSRDAMMTNGVSPNVICGKAPWAFEVWVYKTQIYAGSEDVFAWTARNNWPSSGSNGSCMEFRYGNDVNNAVEHYDGAHNLSWGGAVPAVGQWHHVACARDAGGMERLYLDGALRVSVARGGVNLRDDVGFFTLAGVMDKEGDGTFVNVEQTFSGSIARLRIYDGPLTTGEVIGSYLAECAEFGITPESSPTDQFVWDAAPGVWEAWDTPGNWLYGNVPTDNGAVFIENKGKAGGFSGTNYFRNFNGSDGGFSMTGGLLAVTNTGPLSIASGLPCVFDFELKGGKFHISGMYTGEPHLYLGVNGGIGNMVIGGTGEPAWFCSDAAIQIGKGAGGQGYMEVLQNGLVTVSNNNFFVTAEGATGTVVVAGGTLRSALDNQLILGHGAGAQAKLIVSDGTVGPFNEIQMSQNNPNASTLAEVFLDGGVINIKRFNVNAAGMNYLYFNGGTILNRDSRTGNNADNGFMWNHTAAYVQGGGARFDVIANTTIDVSQPLLAGPDGLGGGLTKLGAGTLNLKGTNTFTGDIAVEGGFLFLRHAEGLASGYSGTITLASGAGIGWETAGGANALLARMDPGTEGALLIFAADAEEAIDLSGYPGLSLGMTGNFQYSGVYTPYNNVYRFSVLNGGNQYREVISGNASVVLDAASTGHLGLHGDSDYTGGTTINGGILFVYHANALGVPAAPGVRDIGIYNGAALAIDVSGMSQPVLDALLARVRTDSEGAILLGGNATGLSVNLTGLPGIRLGAEGGRDHNGILTPHDATVYRLGGGRQDWNNNGGLRHRNLTDAPGDVPRKVVVDLAGSAELATNNLFTGGIVVTNRGALWFQNDTALGAEPPAPVADYLYISDGALRMSPITTRMASHPNRGITVGDGGATFYTPGNRYFVWQGGLYGTGVITNMENGVLMLGSAGNTWTGTLTLNSNNEEGTFAVGWGSNFSWEKTNVIQGNGMFGVATDLDISWTNSFERPLGNTPPTPTLTSGMSAPLGLRKLGEGTLTLDAPNTYTRATRVESGTLKVGIADAIPWGGGKGNVNVQKGNFYPAGVLDINGFDVNINGLTCSGTILDSMGQGKTLTFGNNNQGGTFYGTALPPLKLFKTGDDSNFKFWKGAAVGDFAVQRRTVSVGADTSFGSVTLLNNETGNITTFKVGLDAAQTNGLTGEYFNFDFTELIPLVHSNALLDIVTFETLLAGYAPTWVELSTSFGEGFDAGASGGNGSPNGSQFQGGYNGGNYRFARWTGEFYAEEDGIYGFGSASDDGSVVYINRELIVTNSQDQAYAYANPNIKRGEVELTKGWHDIVIGYYQGTGDRGLTVFMAPPGGEEAILPQALLRPYPVTVGTLAGAPWSRVDIYGNMRLEITGGAPSVYTGRLVSASADAQFIKNGAEDFVFSGQPFPEYDGQVIVNTGTLGLLASAPFTRPIRFAGGTELAILADDADWPNAGLSGTYYAGNYENNQAVASLDAMAGYFGQLAPLYCASTAQTGVLAVADSPDFWYQDRAFFPGPYAYDYPPVSEKTNFRTWFKGKFLAPEPGEYTFGLRSDDRADMFLNGVRVIENTSSGQPEKTATLHLDAGTHDFQIAWGQGSGGYYVQPRVQIPGGVMQRIPNALLRPSVSMIYGVEGDVSVALRHTASYLRFQVDVPQTFDKILTGPGGSEIEKNGAETLTLVLDNDGFYGGWLVMQGTLVVGDGGMSGWLGNADHLHVAAGARLVFNRSDDVVFTGRITGGGEISSIGGRVTLCDIGDGFTGTFTSGLFFIEGNSTLTPEAFAKGQGDGTLNLHMGDGTKLVLPPHDESDPERNPVTLRNVTLELQVGTTNAYFLDALMIQAGKEVKVEGLTWVTGLFGYYYKVDNRDPNWVKDQGHFNTFEDAKAFLQSYPLICKETTWTAGDTMDFAENGSRFPATVRALSPVEYWGALWKGKFLVTEPGDYTFQTRSDDNSMLFIDNQLVVNNNGSHGMIDGYGTRTLAVGLHDFALAYYQGNGGYGLIVSVAPPGQSMQPLPNSMLYADPADCEGEDLSGIPSSAMLTLEIGTLGVVDGPGVGTLNITGEHLVAPMNSTLLLNDLFIESLGAVLAAKGDTALADTNLHVTMGVEPQASSRTLVADFALTPNYGTLLSGKTTSLDGVRNGRLDYKNGNLYVLRAGGTVLILR